LIFKAQFQPSRHGKWKGLVPLRSNWYRSLLATLALLSAIVFCAW